MKSPVRAVSACAGLLCVFFATAAAQNTGRNECIERSASAVVGADGGSVVLTGIGEASWLPGRIAVGGLARFSAVCSTAENELFSETTAILGSYVHTPYFLRLGVPLGGPGPVAVSVTLARPSDSSARLRVFRKVREGGIDELHEVFVPLEDVEVSNRTIRFELEDGDFLPAGREDRESVFVVGWIR